MCFTRHRRILLAHWRSVHEKTVSRIFLGTVSLLLFVILRVNMSMQYCSCSEPPQPMVSAHAMKSPPSCSGSSQTRSLSVGAVDGFSVSEPLSPSPGMYLNHWLTWEHSWTTFEVFLCWVNLEHYKTRTLCLSRHTFLRLVIFSLDGEKSRENIPQVIAQLVSCTAVKYLCSGLLGIFFPS